MRLCFLLEQSVVNFAALLNIKLNFFSMQIKIISVVILFITFSINIFAQDDPILFHVEDRPIHVSEFNYIYSKTNGTKANFSKESVNEYLDLYIKFKLKVEEARALKIDTIPALQRELDGYRKQLSNSYLIDREVKEKLLKEAYERQKKDVNASHIMVTIKGRKQPKDTLIAYNKIMEIKKKLDEGGDFAKTALVFSEDIYSKKNEGKIGWLTAILPSGFYNMETAAYNTPKGKYSNPFRTNMGYHILKVNDTRPARGSIEIAHILARADEKNPEKNPKEIIDKVYAELKAGKDFDQLARTYSDDKKSAAKGGYIGFLGISSSELIFENAAFNLQKDGDFSEPIQTTTGWHIIKRVSKPTLGTYDTEKNRLQVKIEKDARFQEARDQMVINIKKEEHYKVDNKVLSSFVESLDKEFLSNKWRAPKKSDAILFSFGKNKEKTYTLGGFTDFLLRSARQRIQMGRGKTAKIVVTELLEAYSNNMALEYEKSQLSRKYPDFRALMREYEEGILLFEVTKMLVWDKASKDTLGIKNYYNNNKSDYLWGERANISIYTLKSQSEKILNKARKLAKKKPSKTVLKKINKLGNLLSVTDDSIEKGKNKYKDLDKKNWKKGTLSPNIINNDNTVTFIKIEEMLPREQKSLKEARGYVIADYQDALEEQWIQELRKKYKVNINQEALKSIIK